LTIGHGGLKRLYYDAEADSRRVVDCHENGNLRCYYITKPALAKWLVRFLTEEFPVVERSATTVRRLGMKRQESAQCT